MYVHMKPLGSFDRGLMCKLWYLSHSLSSSICSTCNKLNISYILAQSFALPELFTSHLTHMVHCFDLKAFFVILWSFLSSMCSMCTSEYVHFASFWPFFHLPSTSIIYPRVFKKSESFHPLHWLQYVCTWKRRMKPFHSFLVNSYFKTQ